jgi:hypothetical protein
MEYLHFMDDARMDDVWRRLTFVGSTVAHYTATNDHTVLGKVAENPRSAYPSSVWASTALPWLPKE